MSNYFERFSAVIADTDIAKKNGLSYLSAAMAMTLAGRPQVTFVDFDGKPHLECLGGALVAVDLPVSGGDKAQRMWLPVMDQDNSPIPVAKLSATDINNSRTRCLVKALAATYGVGMSLYMACDGDGAKATKLLGVEPGSDLASIEPLVATLKEGGAPHIEWNTSLAACCITDPVFSWEVVMWDGLPYREVFGGLMVDVDTVYNGKYQRLSLPIMDGAFNAIPAGKATVFDWNKAVMRALAKCVAFNTGYGLSVYAEDVGGAEADKVKGKGRGRTKAEAAPKAEEPKAEEAKVPVTTDAQGALAETPTETPADAKPAKADTTADASAEASAEASAPAAEEQDFVTRFKRVIKGRLISSGNEGLIELFERLASSDKFAEEEKPVCYGVLMQAVATSVGTAAIGSAVRAIAKFNAMKYVAADVRDSIASRLVSIALAKACSDGDDVLRVAPDALVKAGVASSVEEVIRLAKLGNTAKETLDLLDALREPAAA